MALPTIALAAHWSTVLPDDWSVIQGPISSLEPPAVVSGQMVNGSLLVLSVSTCSATLQLQLSPHPHQRRGSRPAPHPSQADGESA